MRSLPTGFVIAYLLPAPPPAASATPAAAPARRVRRARRGRLRGSAWAPCRGTLALGESFPSRRRGLGSPCRERRLFSAPHARARLAPTPRAPGGDPAGRLC